MSLSYVRRLPLLIALAVVFALTLIAGGPTTAHAALNDAKIKSASNSISSPLLVVCKDWDGGTNKCKAGSPQEALSPGERSPWADADGYYIRSGYKVKLPISGKTVTTAGWQWRVSPCLPYRLAEALATATQQLNHRRHTDTLTLDPNCPDCQHVLNRLWTDIHDATLNQETP